MTALCMGYAVVIFEATLSAVGFARDVREELPLLRKGSARSWHPCC